mmetsp:Transcript_8364/g.9326  ORF Transcript_8364/g.9326 Transcript_8364/m.9326 type:complete len:558 (+) Transcript_8364:65-1738(+)|eukprot:CAMPEP_0168523278 /NCGR_PEP_ID=MMETSP0405-20121227/9887_1 /TAXON_ID=498012 /ORGANISM="Trichosphaerium sp, Strain Am-I-7 wt" /LENGTH=557 /DNA_ID=CAMNT_0008545119 /DNA_START=45 /DNA_END=1718 /DNA_ORIENTATION=+
MSLRAKTRWMFWNSRNEWEFFGRKMSREIEKARKLSKRGVVRIPRKDNDVMVINFDTSTAHTESNPEKEWPIKRTRHTEYMSEFPSSKGSPNASASSLPEVSSRSRKNKSNTISGRRSLKRNAAVTAFSSSSWQPPDTGFMSVHRNSDPGAVNIDSVVPIQDYNKLKAKKQKLTSILVGRDNQIGTLKSEITNLMKKIKELETDRGLTHISYKELEIEHTLGSGAQATVNLATWRGAHVAVKQFLQGSTESLLSELSQLSRLPPHPFVVNFYGLTRTKHDKLGLVLEYVAGGSLQDYIYERSEDLSPRFLIGVIRNVSAGIHHLHCCHVVHRDIASRNILITLTHQAKVTDFGFSRHMGAQDSTKWTQTKVCPPRWMAPESLIVREGGIQYSKESDVWMFGCLLYEMFFRQTPYHYLSNVTDVIQSVARNAIQLERPENCPKIAKLMNMSLQFHKRERSSMKQILNYVSKKLDETDLVPVPHVQRTTHGLLGASFIERFGINSNALNTDTRNIGKDDEMDYADEDDFGDDFSTHNTNAMDYADDDDFNEPKEYVDSI